MNMDGELIEKLKSNLFPYSWAAIDNWDTFPWHETRKGIDSFVTHSSQALSIDLFGTLKVLPSRHLFLAELARRLELPDDGMWEVELEWLPKSNPLNERRLTQVDAITQSKHSIILFECKFTENSSGACSQPQPLKKGLNRGIRQCDGNYRHQVNPVNGIKARCSLTGKSIRYWEYVPYVFSFDSGLDYIPCPFSGSWFQWMRNLTLAESLSQESGKKVAFCIIYVDSLSLPITQMLSSQEWSNLCEKLRDNTVKVTTYSYQQILQMAERVDPGNRVWLELSQWITRKVESVIERQKR
jgi:hypothetical protein